MPRKIHDVEVDGEVYKMKTLNVFKAKSLILTIIPLISKTIKPVINDIDTIKAFFKAIPSTEGMSDEEKKVARDKSFNDFLSSDVNFNFGDILESLLCSVDEPTFDIIAAFVFSETTHIEPNSEFQSEYKEEMGMPYQQYSKMNAKAERENHFNQHDGMHMMTLVIKGLMVQVGGFFGGKSVGAKLLKQATSTLG